MRPPREQPFGKASFGTKENHHSVVFMTAAQPDRWSTQLQRVVSSCRSSHGQLRRQQAQWARWCLMQCHVSGRGSVRVISLHLLCPKSMRPTCSTKVSLFPILCLQSTWVRVARQALNPLPHTHTYTFTSFILLLFSYIRAATRITNCSGHFAPIPSSHRPFSPHFRPTAALA